MPRYLLAALTLTLLTGLTAHAQTTAPTKSQAPISSTASETIAIGTLIGHEGLVAVMTPDGEAHPLSNSAPIHIHDIIETGPEARALIVLIDNTEITLGENAQFTVDEYIFAEDNEATNKARYSILRGAFLYASASGTAKSKQASDIVVNTPYASIGIRSAKFWGGEIDGTYGIHVTDGQVSVQSGRGRIGVDKDTGTSLVSKMDIPSRAITWEQEKLDRAIAATTMKDAEKLRTRISENAETQKLQRDAYKLYLAKNLEERKQLKDARTPSTRIDNVPAPAPVKGPSEPPTRQKAPTEQLATPAAPVAPAPVLEQQPPQNEAVQDEKGQDKDAEVSPAPTSGAPKIDLPSMPEQEQPTRRLAPSSGAAGRSKAADAL